MTTLTLLHGFTGSARTWDAHRAAFEEYALSTPDLPGHGADVSHNPADYHIDHVAQVLNTQIAAQPSPRVLLGYSLGGRVALTMATQQPRLYDALVLESASPGIAHDAERTARRAADDTLAEQIEQRGIAWFVEYWEALPLFASHARLPNAVRDEQRRQRLLNDPHGLALSLRGMGAGVMPPLWDALPTLTMPVLLISGADDAKYTTLAEQMAARLPDAQHVVISNSGHTPHLEQPKMFESSIIRFLKRKNL
jgi:2-succinyl-6-hydroxy-2,4-cyclohexadiene-1-carboxylate synthase